MPDTNGPELKTHVYDIDASVEFAAEQKILEDLVRSGQLALDVGCGASGRSSLRLAQFGAVVHAIDYNEETVAKAKLALAGHEKIVVEHGDMLDLKFDDNFFDFVFVALCGMDYLIEDSERTHALRELARVLKPGGHLAFSSLNRVGVVTNPPNAREWDQIKWRIKHIFSGRFLQPTLLDIHGLRMRQRLPRTIIRETCDATGLTFSYATNQQATRTDHVGITLLSWLPHFVFRKSS